MKNQALFSSKDKSKKLHNVVCCNFCLALKGLNNIKARFHVEVSTLLSFLNAQIVHCALR